MADEYKLRTSEAGLIEAILTLAKANHTLSKILSITLEWADLPAKAREEAHELLLSHSKENQRALELARQVVEGNYGRVKKQ